MLGQTFLTANSDSCGGNFKQIHGADKAEPPVERSLPSVQRLRAQLNRLREQIEVKRKLGQKPITPRVTQERPMKKPRQLLFNGKAYDCRAGETVLDALIRQHVDVPYSCRQQVCLTCMMHCLNGPPPSASQVNIKETLRIQNNFLACGCYPESDMEIALPNELIGGPVSAEVVELNRLNPAVLEVVLQCSVPLDYRAGQAVRLRNEDLLGKRLLIASPTSAKGSGRFEIHVERIQGDLFSEWVYGQLRIGDKFTLYGVDGELSYVPGQPWRPTLLAAWHSGLGAPSRIPSFSDEAEGLRESRILA